MTDNSARYALTITPTARCQLVQYPPEAVAFAAGRWVGAPARRNFVAARRVAPAPAESRSRPLGRPAPSGNLEPVGLVGQCLRAECGFQNRPSVCGSGASRTTFITWTTEGREDNGGAGAHLGVRGDVSRAPDHAPAAGLPDVGLARGERGRRPVRVHLRTRPLGPDREPVALPQESRGQSGQGRPTTTATPLGQNCRTTACGPSPRSRRDLGTDSAAAMVTTRRRRPPLLRGPSPDRGCKHPRPLDHNRPFRSPTRSRQAPKGTLTATVRSMRAYCLLVRRPGPGRCDAGRRVWRADAAWEPPAKLADSRTGSVASM